MASLGDFELLSEHFARLDMQIRQDKGISVFDTSHGIYGTSDLVDVYEFFKDIKLEGKFVDLGSGDGRIALLAALFTDSLGIEADVELHEMAIEQKRSLVKALPKLKRCELVRGDYFEEDLSCFDVLFIYADHSWPKEFQEKLKRECSGKILYSHHNVFSPDSLKKGRTFWVGQTPFVSYHL